ncbi:helix-turn-helix transcriptional regulator [Saccharothrix syringae]|uniref:XRE family transcriptional regulator n=1 Tax=Saccharothrix syringae TaxID=103733 RepID=A0A5Q0H4M8_SACSY|nr:helix-turn-helix transcriptional regulator [Saccharothrix syringae]QFZ20963.1 XRE family transcriptional regulator [Saccharothrix syringae]
MKRLNDLGEFLRSRRAQLRPEQLGLVNHGRRRVAGLRREEVAQLAGVSVAYYTRLEQGLTDRASDAVLDAVARVLQLDEDAHAHLHRLARGSRRDRPRVRRPERLRPSIALMVESFTAAKVPALVIGRSTDVLAWNRLAHGLLAGHLDFDAPNRPADRPNITRMVFLDPHVRELYPDWKRKCRDTVDDLRLVAGRYQDDARLAELVGELSMKSPEFTALWNNHAVKACAYSAREFHHPLVGPLTLANELLVLPDDDGQRLALFHAEPGSPSEAALSLLADLVTSGARPPAVPSPRPSLHPGA